MVTEDTGQRARLEVRPGAFQPVAASVNRPGGPGGSNELI